MSGLTMCLLCAVAAAAPGEETRRLALKLEVRGGPEGLRDFLWERSLQTWETDEAKDEMHEADQLLTFFYVAIQWLSDHQVSVVVEQDGQPLTDRTIEVADPIEAKLTLWLLLKSSLNRGLKQARQSQQGPGASGSEAGGKAIPKTPPASKRRVAGLNSAGDASVTMTRPSPAKIEPTSPVASKDRRALPTKPAPVAVAWGVMSTVWLETPKLLAFGFHGACHFYWRFLALGVLAGYRYSSGAHGLRLHGLPLTLLMAFETGKSVRAAIGLVLSGEIKVPVVRTHTQIAVGAEGGLHVQARVPVASERFFILRAAMTWRLVRAEYRHFDNQGIERRIRERPWTQIISAGVEWQ